MKPSVQAAAVHPTSTPPDSVWAVPEKGTAGEARTGGWSDDLFKALGRRESLLPKKVLESHVRRLLRLREALLESAVGFGTPQYFFDEASLRERILRFKAIFD